MNSQLVDSHDLTIVTACRNREKNLSIVLPSWLRLNPASILICDWGSVIPLTYESLGLNQVFANKIKIIRVDTEIAQTWVLTWAFNEALAKVRTPFILKLDCDHKVSDDILKKNPLEAGMFSRGHWRNARDGQQYINGAFFSCTDLLKNVGYYDERITTYGWDDSDLYARLYDACSGSRIISSGSIHHIDQDEEERTINQSVNRESVLADELGIKKTEFLISRNRILCGMLWPWTSRDYSNRLRIRDKFYNLEPEQKALFEYATLKTFELHYRLKGLENKANISASEAYSVALYASKVDRSCLPISVGIAHFLDMYSNAVKQRDTALQGMVRHLLINQTNSRKINNSRNNSLDSIHKLHLQNTESLDLDSANKSNAISAGSTLPKLYIDAQHGLGNRLRAIGSAAAIAKNEGYELVIVWQPDEHCDCYFHDLFEYDGPVIDSSFNKINDRNIRLYNYMEIEGGKKNEPINCGKQQSIYVRSAFTLSHDSSTWSIENKFIQSLKPVKKIRDLVNSVEFPSDVSVHIRMGETIEGKLPSYEKSDGNWSAADQELINMCREKSSINAFSAYLDILISKNPSLTIFLACDNEIGYHHMLKRYGAKISRLRRSVYDRSSKQIQYALADAILLSKSDLLLGSNWSSFTELARRFSINNLPIKLAGIDF